MTNFMLIAASTLTIIAEGCHPRLEANARCGWVRNIYEIGDKVPKVYPMGNDGYKLVTVTPTNSNRGYKDSVSLVWKGRHIKVPRKEWDLVISYFYDK